MKIIAVFCFLCSLWLGGCSYTSPLPLNELPDKSGPLLSERMDRVAVHDLLGTPHVASRWWGLELYRDAASQTEILMALLIPYGMIKDDLYRYTLVSYGQDHSTQSAVTGILRKPSGWRVVSPIERNYLSVHLQTPDFTFFSGWEDRYETLLASPVRRDMYLERIRLLPQGIVVIGCGTRGCSSKLSIDEGPDLPVPCRLLIMNMEEQAKSLLKQGKLEEYASLYPPVQIDTVTAISLAPGNHTLKASGGRWTKGGFAGLFGGEHSIRFSCREGEILYIIIDVFAEEYTAWGAKNVQWKLDLYHEMPEIFADRPLVLYRGDQWLADPEPGN